MADQVTISTWSAARKTAGVSDARQVRDVKFGNAITYAKNRFLALFTDSIPGQDKKGVSVAPVIKSRGVKTLEPEIYDVDVLPNNFELMADTSAIGVGDTATLTLNSGSGLEVDMTLNNPRDEAMARITSVSGASIGIKVVYSSGGSKVWTKGDGIKNLERMNSATTDAPTVGVGTNREPLNITNMLQFSHIAMSQGILQGLLALHGNMDDAELGDWKQEQKLKFLDMQRAREATMLLSQASYEEGTGASRVMHAKGLIGFAGGVVPNGNEDGSLSFENFMQVNMSGAREGGGSFDIWGFCGLHLATVLTAMMYEKVRITNVSEQFRCNYRRFETPAGNLNLVICDAFDSEVRRGQMLTIIPENIERLYLKGLDLKYLEGLEVNNILGKRAAYAVCEAILPSNTKSLKLHTGILKAA